MQDFKERWNSDSKFKAKTQLGLYGVFILLVLIFALLNGGMTPKNNTYFDVELNNQDNQETTNIEIPEEYSYTTNIKINNQNYQYSGIKEASKESITKTSDNVITRYLYQNNSYYKEENGEYILTNKDEVYDIVSHNYLKLETINQYLTKSKKENTRNIVYLKDIILGNDSEEYIVITINENKIDIDYTSLMRIFDLSVESYLIEITIEEIE